MYIYVHIYIYRVICLMSTVFTNGPGDVGSIPGRVIPNTQKGSRVKWINLENQVRPSLHLDAAAFENGVFGSPSTKVANFTF